MIASLAASFVFLVEDLRDEKNHRHTGQGSAAQHGQERPDKSQRFQLPNGARQRQLWQSQSSLIRTFVLRIMESNVEMVLHYCVMIAFRDITFRYP